MRFTHNMARIMLLKALPCANFLEPLIPGVLILEYPIHNLTSSSS